jgi:hypothetical protein
MKKFLLVLALAGLSVNVSFAAKKSTLDIPVFEASEFPYPSATGRDVLSQEDFLKKFSKSDLAKMKKACDVNNGFKTKDYTNVKLTRKTEFCVGVNVLTEYWRG